MNDLLLSFLGWYERERSQYECWLERVMIREMVEKWLKDG